MTTIYIDIIFLENLFMNYIILFATGIIVKTQLRVIRTIISSTIGATYAVVVYMSLLKMYSNIFLKIMLSISMVYIAFNSKNIKVFLKQVTIFYLTSFTFGGVAFALLYFISPQNILMERGVLIGTYPIKIVLAGGIIGFIIITSSFKNIKGKLTKKDMFCSMKININNKDIYVKAIIDTGNFLKDPITKLPVVVIQKEVLVNVIPNYILDNLDRIINGDNINLGEYISKIRIIPFSSLGKENGILLGVKVDEILIEREDKIINIDTAIIGIYNGILNRSGKYESLIGLELLEGGGIKDEYIKNIKV
ncbi:MAG: sigma-E processing peptidase SpoIIGA [Clostridia bacterium]|nr:sigma-E processing peptidase SpoIIGA [Clostridia bacterium]